MRVVILQDQLRGGGTEKHTVLIANQCQAAGFAVRVLLFRPGGHRFAELQAPHQVLQPFDMRLNGWAPGLARAIREHAPTVLLAMGRMANRKLPGLRRTFPGLFMIATARSGRPIGTCCLRALMAADRVWVNSRWMLGQLQGAGLVHRDVRYIPNVVHIPKNGKCVPQQARTALRADLGVAHTTRVLIHAGRFRHRKGQRELIAITRRLPADLNWALWLLGDGPHLSSCRRLASKLGTADRVCFHGYQNDPTPFLAAADIAVCASRSESMPNFLIEAQAHGLPVVAWRHAGIEETFAVGKTGLLTPEGEPEAFATALQTLMVDHDQHMAFATAAPGLVAERFNPDATMAAYIEALSPTALA